MSEESAVAIDEDNVDTSGAPSDTLAPIAHVALPPGVSQVDFEAALAAGRAKGQLTQAELIEALHTVELTPEVLTTLIDRVTAEGVALVADEEEDLGVEVAPTEDTRAVPKSNGALRADAGGRRAPTGTATETGSGPPRAVIRAAVPRTRSTPISRRSAGFRCSTPSSRSRSPRPSRRATRRRPGWPPTSWPWPAKGRPRTCSTPGGCPGTSGSCATGSRRRTSSSRPTCASSSPSPSGTATAAWPSST